MELNKLLKRVRDLIEKAEHPIAEGATPEQRDAAIIEQEAARKMADALIMQYAIDEAMLDKSRPAALQSKPGAIEVELTTDHTLDGYVGALAETIARHCNCLIRTYRRYDYAEHVWKAKVYGFESDLRYFEIQYTTLRLHMIGALRPHIDYGLSDEDNAYTLHSAGLNWFEIAKMYGWRGPVKPEPGEPKLMYVNEKTGQRLNWSKSIQQYKRYYQAAVKARGETELRVPPSGGDTFRRSSAQGYVNRIAQRLRQIREGRQVGTALSLRVDLLSQFFKEDNPELFVVNTEPVAVKAGRARKVTYAPFSQSAYEAGTKHANGANLNPAAPSNPSKEIS